MGSGEIKTRQDLDFLEFWILSAFSYGAQLSQFAQVRDFLGHKTFSALTEKVQVNKDNLFTQSLHHPNLTLAYNTDERYLKSSISLLVNRSIGNCNGGFTLN